MKPLFKHQRDTVLFCSKKDVTFDASDPGTGKTRSAIELFILRRRRGAGCALVIAPKTLLHSAWDDDIKQFAPQLITSVATATNRILAFRQEADVYITNTDATKWLALQDKAFFDKFDFLIIDELSTFKHHTSQRSKALNKIKKYFKFRHGMTGTPNSNTIADVWHQIFVLDNGQRLGTSFFQFRGSVCEPEQQGPRPEMVKWKDKDGAEDVVAALLADITIRHKFENCIDIPENFMRSISYHLSPQQFQVYKQMEKHAIAELQTGAVSAINAAAVTTKLLQIASGAVYDESSVKHLVDTGRYELVSELILERKNCIVFFLWEHQRDNLIKSFEANGVTFALIDGSTSENERRQAVANFQAGFYRVILAHPQSAAHGLTLTRGTTTIWCSPTYNLEHFTQGNKRIYRAGQTERTETIVILAPGTIESKVYQSLVDKNIRQMNLLDMLQEDSDVS